MKNNIVTAVLFFIGYILSPLTWWNDAFVNLPISYFCASIVSNLSGKYFLESFIVSYWISNILGIYLMHIFGNAYLKEKFKKNRLAVILFNIAMYSAIIGFLAYFNFIKPLMIKL